MLFLQYALVNAQDENRIKKAYQLIRKWKLNSPNLIVSVTGGAKNFKLKPQLKKAFRKSLMKVAETSGARFNVTLHTEQTYYQLGQCNMSTSFV